MTDVAFFGKIPSAPDFVRFGISSPIRDFENWVHDNAGELRSAGAKSLPGPARFLYPTDAHTVAGVAIPSSDRVGRQFPAVVAAALPSTGPLSRGVAVLASERFFEDASAAVEAHHDADPEVLWNQVAPVRPPDASDVTAAEARLGSILDEGNARDMEAACFAGPDDRFYGYHTLRLAVRDAPPPDPRVLMCPTAGETRYCAFWAEAVERATERRIPLPLLWTGVSLMVGLGRAPKSMLRFGAGLGGRSNALWPLSTPHTNARERAKGALAGELWDEPEQKLGRLIDALMRIQV